MNYSNENLSVSKQNDSTLSNFTVVALIKRSQRVRLSFICGAKNIKSSPSTLANLKIDIASLIIELKYRRENFTIHTCENR